MIYPLEESVDLIIIALIGSQNPESFQVPFGELGSDLGVVLSGGGHMQIKHRLGFGIHQQGSLEGANLELYPLGVVAAGIASVAP